MGSDVRGGSPPFGGDDDQNPLERESERSLHEFLSGRFADVGVDPVEAVRRVRRRDRE